MHSFVLLMRLQIMEALGGFREQVEKRTGISARLSLLASVVIALLLLLLTGSMGYGLCSACKATDAAFSIIPLLFLITGIMTFVLSLPTILSSFFGESDVEDFLSMPLSESAIVASKAFGVLGSSYLWTLYLIVGPLAGWGICMGEGPSYWVAYLMAVIFTPFLPTAYAGILSMIISRVFKRVRRKDTITSLATVLSFAASIVLYFVSQSLTRERSAQTVNELSHMFGGAVTAFPAYTFEVSALVDGNVFGALVFALISLAVFGIFILVARLFYLKIVTSLSAGGGGAATFEGTSLKSSSTFSSLVHMEILRTVRCSGIMMNYVVFPVLITPIFVCFSLTKSDNSLASLISGSTIGANITFVVFILPVISLLVLISSLSNGLPATAFSREGSNWIWMKFVPVPIIEQVYAKLLPGFFENVFIFLLLSGVMGVLTLSSGVDPLLFLGTLVYVFANLWVDTTAALRMGCILPKLDWGDDGNVTVNEVKNNTGILRQMLLVLAQSLFPVVVIGLAYFIMGQAFSLDMMRLAIAVLALVAVVYALIAGRASVHAAARAIERYE